MKASGWVIGFLSIFAACNGGPDEVIPPPPDAPIPVDAPADAPVDAPDDAPGDAPDGGNILAPYDPDGLPDIVLDADTMASSWVVQSEFFTENACEIVEACIGGPGLRRLLKFATITGNAGANDLVMGDLPPDGSSEGLFEWSACHGHHHFTTYADYQLLDTEGSVASGHKQAFCLMDTGRMDGVNVNGRSYNCGRQGISRGWQDTYGVGLPCQWIDITDVPPGTYTVRVVINEAQNLAEMSYENNSTEFSVTF